MDLALVKYRALYNRKKSLNKNGKAPIEVECLLKRQRKFISTGILITPAEWTSTKNHSYVNSKNPLANALNTRIKSIMHALANFELDARAKNGVFVLSEFNNFLNNDKPRSYTAFFEHEIDLNKNLQPNTKKSHIKTLTKLKAFKGNIDFKDVDYSFVRAFDAFLIEKYNLGANSRWGEHKNVKVYLNLAIKKGLFELENYPYTKFKVKKVATNRDYLTNTELEAIENIRIPNGNHLNVIRDLFLLSCYTGLRFSDLVRIRNEHISVCNEGLILTMTIQKTKDVIQIPVYSFFKQKTGPSKPEIIINKYLTNEGIKGTFFRDLTNQYVNREIKVLAQMAGIYKNVTCHVGRHTFAVFMTSKKLPVQVLQRLLGHSDVRTTMIYQKFTPEFIAEQLNNVSW